ncbi:hypothetical protein L2E82_37609 [Cichorium intybus]|uniref:Uncharacterized protein n=1 Tax=Cichorium intybus TaxID=13427 RepID=A0ACB9AER1_CICIN|nr:hypothetical protein L2E82_37609 [Cichorium intybus]
MSVFSTTPLPCSTIITASATSPQTLTKEISIIQRLSTAIYTLAINQKALSDTETSLIFSNQAHVNLLLGNYGRALSESEEAIKLSPTNLKAFYSAAKSSLSLNKLVEARAFI